MPLSMFFFFLCCINPAVSNLLTCMVQDVVHYCAVQCVKLMQKVSYGFKIATDEPYVDDLVTYLIKQM